MSYDLVAPVQPSSLVDAPEDEDGRPLLEVSEPAPTRVTRRALYVCFGVTIAVKALIVCWLLTTSLPLDAIERLMRGEWFIGDGEE